VRTDRRTSRPGTTTRALALLVALVAVASAGCSRPDDGRTTLARIREQGVVRVGFANEAPFAYRDPETGALTGEAPEIARLVLARMGVDRVEGVLTEFGSLIPGLQAHRFDVIAAGMYVTPERCRRVAFSEPTYAIHEAFMVQAGNPSDLHSYADVATSADATLGVVAGTVERGYARELGVPDARIVTFPDAPSAAAGVAAGRADAFAGTSLTIEDLLAKSGAADLERAAPFHDPVIDGREVRGYGAFAFRLDDRALLAEFNRHLAALLGTAEHLDAVRPFGFGKYSLPDGVTTAELCAR
jgi:polar amino acid transport system substrate-binding protein